MNRVLWVPFLVLLFVLPFPGTVALRLLCLAVAFLAAAALWRCLDPPPLPCKPALALWAGIALVSLVYAVDPSYSLGEIKNEIGYTMMAFAAFFAATRAESALRASLVASVLSAAAIALWAIPLALQQGEWQQGAGHGGSGIYGTLTLMVLPLIFLLWELAPKARSLWGVLSLVLLVAGYYSQQRVIWSIIGLQAACLVLLLRAKGSLKWSALGIAVVLLGTVLAVGALTAVTQTSRARHAFTVDIDQDVRFAQWPRIAVRIFERPLTGVGFGRNAMKLGHADLIPKDTPTMWHAHNVFLNYGLGLGLPGVAALVYVFFCLALCYWWLYRHTDATASRIGTTGLLLIVAVVSRNLTNDFFLRDMAILFWALNGALLGCGLRRARISAP